MIIHHFDLQPQFKYVNYFIYTSHQNLCQLPTSYSDFKEHGISAIIAFKLHSIAPFWTLAYQMQSFI